MTWMAHLRDLAVTLAAVMAMYMMYQVVQRDMIHPRFPAAAPPSTCPSSVPGAASSRPSSPLPPQRLPHSSPSPSSALFYEQGVKRQRRPDASLLVYDEHEWPLAIVADLDHASRHPTKHLWRSLLKKGTLRREPGARNFTLEWHETLELTSKTATKNRSMELSELVRFNHLLLAICDITGLVWKVVLPSSSSSSSSSGSAGASASGSGSSPQVFMRYAIADGDGERAKAFKGEWATVKDGLLWVGSTGKEWTNLATGHVEHRNPEWVKAIDGNGRIENYDWGVVYQVLRTKANASWPGYMWHEAVHWDPIERVWVFLPRKVSHGEPYAELADERKGSNLLLIASEDFSEVTVRTLGEVEPAFGFSALRKLPGTRGLYAALKTAEYTDRDTGRRVTRTKMSVFDLNGEFYMSGDGSSSSSPWVLVDEQYKYEGLDFLNDFL